VKIEFTQEGQTLRLTSDSAPVQYADALPVQITVDADYASATELCLMTQPHKYLPSRTVLTLSNRTAAGKISRTALMQSGLVDFVLSGKIGDTILPTASCRVYVLPSVDPQSAQLAQDPETVTSIVDASVAKYLTEHPATTGATEKEAAQIAANTAALDTKLSTDGYSTGDLAKIPVVDKNGNLTVRNVHMLLEQADGEDALVLRGAVNQIVASVAIADLKNALGIANGATVLDMYPVGSIYQTTSSTFNPQTAWGGTWERIKDRFLLAAGDTYTGGSTGGEATHKLTVQELPSHQHVMIVNNEGSSSSWVPQFDGYVIKTDCVTQSKKNYQAKLAQNGAGLDQAHNNMPPYIAVYVWKRTA
jgi:hypothetical protein